MYQAYEQIFEGDDSEEMMEYKNKLIPNTKLIAFKQHLEKVQKVINTATFTDNGFIKFKWEMIKFEQKCKRNFFTWDLNHHIMIDINSLKTPQEVYTICMGIENVWGLYDVKSDSLPSVWKTIDKNQN